MPLINDIIKIKEHIKDDKITKNIILKQHNCTLDQNENIVFHKNDINKIFTFSVCGISLFYVIISFFPYFLTATLFIFILFSSTIFFVNHSIKKIDERNLLTHNDFLHLSTILSKEDIYKLTYFYENQFYEEESNQNKTYKLNLRDLFEPLDRKKYQEDFKNIHTQKFYDFLDSVYESK